MDDCNTFDLYSATFVIKILFLSIFELPFYTGFTVVVSSFLLFPHYMYGLVFSPGFVIEF